MGVGSLIRITVLEYSIQQAFGRYFSLKHSRQSLTMEVLVTRMKNGVIYNLVTNGNIHWGYPSSHFYQPVYVEIFPIKETATLLRRVRVINQDNERG